MKGSKVFFFLKKSRNQKKRSIAWKKVENEWTSRIWNEICMNVRWISGESCPWSYHQSSANSYQHPSSMSNIRKNWEKLLWIVLFSEPINSPSPTTKLTKYFPFQKASRPLKSKKIRKITYPVSSSSWNTGMYLSNSTKSKSSDLILLVKWWFQALTWKKVPKNYLNEVSSAFPLSFVDLSLHSQSKIASDNVWLKFLTLVWLS